MRPIGHSVRRIDASLGRSGLIAQFSLAGTGARGRRESQFGIRFTSREVDNMARVADFAETIERKTEGRG